MNKKFRMVSSLLFGSAIVTFAVIAGGFFSTGRSAHYPVLRQRSTDQNVLATLSKATGWVNSSGLTFEDLRGKVVLINFCTYSCINWLRTLPYIRAWSDKYKAKGLVVIGIHTPEFEFEKRPDNVMRALKERKIGYAIATDNKMDIWNAFGNSYWPAFYFIDTKGQIRHEQFGEGEYDKSEKVIQLLLEESGAAAIDYHLVSVNAAGVEASADWGDLLSPENYFGDDRSENFKPKAVALKLNQWTLAGKWRIKNNSILLGKANGKIIYRFHARDLNLVMGPVNFGTVVRYRVLINGNPPITSHGSDIDEQGYGTVTEQRLYQIIRQTGFIAEQQFEIEFLDADVEAFSITFG